jgi:cysteine desulfurase
MRVYFDNAATTPVYPEVVKEMMGVLSEDYGNASSIHRHGRTAKSIIEQSRKTVAKLINASIGDVFFTSSATEANNMVLKNAVRDLGITHIISSPTEHPCILESLDNLSEHCGTTIIYIKVDSKGNLDYLDLEKHLSSSPRSQTLVSLMHGNNELGTMSDIDLIGSLCAQYGALYHVDAVQTLTKIHLDVQHSQIHFLSGSAHKFHGPKGVGLVYIDSRYMLQPYIHGGAQERNMRAGTENVAGIAAMAKAIILGQERRETSQAHIRQLRTLFIDGLLNLEDIQINGNSDDNYLQHILSVSFPPSSKADMLVINLDIAGVSASSASACSAGIEEDSHVMKAIGHPVDRKTIRFSFSMFNTVAEVNYALEQIAKLYR